MMKQAALTVATLATVNADGHCAKPVFEIATNAEIGKDKIKVKATTKYCVDKGNGCFHTVTSYPDGLPAANGQPAQPKVDPTEGSTKFECLEKEWKGAFTQITSYDSTTCEGAPNGAVEQFYTGSLIDVLYYNQEVTFVTVEKTFLDQKLVGTMAAGGIPGATCTSKPATKEEEALMKALKFDKQTCLANPMPNAKCACQDPLLVQCAQEGLAASFVALMEEHEKTPMTEAQFDAKGDEYLMVTGATCAAQHITCKDDPKKDSAAEIFVAAALGDKDALATLSGDGSDATAAGASILAGAVAAAAYMA